VHNRKIVHISEWRNQDIAFFKLIHLAYIQNDRYPTPNLAW
jgi:hypothetical protein